MIGIRSSSNPVNLTNDAAFRLATKSKQNDVVPRQNGIDELRDHRVVVANNAWKKSFASAQFSDQVQTQLVFHGMGLIPGGS